MPGARDVTSATRPALATAGGLLLALALLQIVQQVIGVFKPRPEIQASLIVAAGLAALCAQRVSSAGGLNDRVVVGSAVGCGIALAAAVAILLTSGFSLPTPPSIAAQVQRIRTNARSENLDETAYRRASLRPGTTAHLFVFDQADLESEPDLVSERVTSIRLYEEMDGQLKPRFAFEPTPPRGGFESAATGDRSVFDPRVAKSSFSARFVLMELLDIDQDGQPEHLGNYELVDNDDLIRLRIPVVLGWRDSAARYELSGLFREAPTLGDVGALDYAIDVKAFTTAFRLNDPRARVSVDGHAVSSFFAIPEDQSIVASFDRGRRGARDALQVGVWSVGDLSDPPPLSQHCYESSSRQLGPSVFNPPAPAGDKAVRRLYGRLPEAGGGLVGRLIDGDCLFGE